jgi:hypothetical protein
MKSDNKEIVSELIETVFPDYSKGFYEPMQYKDMSDNIFASCIETIYSSYGNVKEKMHVFPGFTFEEQYNSSEDEEPWFELKRTFLRKNKEKIISLIDPNNLLWFLVPKEEHEYIYKDLAALGTTYFMSM